MPKTIKIRLKKKTVGTETDVQDRLSDIKNRFMQRQKTVVTYSILAVTVVLVIAAIVFYQYTAKAKSRQLEYEAYTIYYNEYQKESLSKQERFQKALGLFQQAYSKSRSPRLLLYIADSYYELDRYDEALAHLDEFIKEYTAEKDMLPLAYQKTAMIHLKKGNKDEALKTLDILYKSATNIYKDLALIESGRILDEDGKKQKAAAKYKELTERFPESPFFEEAKGKLVEKKKAKESS